MNLIDLPIELVTIILSYLDTKSKINIYNCSSEMKKFFAPCLMKRVSISRSVIGKLETLKQSIFFDLGTFIQELNLSSVPDLQAGNLKVHLKHMKNLRHLDITFTDIFLSEFVDILCPENLESLSVNFFKNPRNARLNDIWDIARDLFREKQFTKVHFVVFDFLESDIPMSFLNGIPIIEDLKITVADNYKDVWEIDDEDSSITKDDVEINFSKLNYVFRDCRVTHKTSKVLRGVANLDYNRLEYIFIMYLERIVIYVSPIFQSTFMVHCSDLQVDVSYFLPQNFMLDGNIIFKAWNKDATSFDDKFFKDLSQELRHYFPTYVCMHKLIRMQVTPSPNQWFCIDNCDGFEYVLTDLPENVTLTDFCRRDGVIKRSKRPITLKPEASTLQNLTFLRLSNIYLQHDFFTILFSSAKRLATLDLYMEKQARLRKFRGNIQWLSNAIHLTTSLKNIKLTSEDIAYETIFEVLSRCPTLENVHICEYERSLGHNEISTINIVLMIEKCINLYSLFIEADLSPENLTILMSPLRDAAQKNGRDHLTIEVCDCYRGWNPFVDVFNPSPLHILD